MGEIAITILLALSEKFQEGADERMARAVLVSETRHGGPVPDERRVEDFVCCEVPIGEDTAMALEVFTSRERAEAELRGMERLAPGAYYPRPANKHLVRSTSGEPDKTLSDRVDEFVRYELS